MFGYAGLYYLCIDFIIYALFFNGVAGHLYINYGLGKTFNVSLP